VRVTDHARAIGRSDPALLRKQGDEWDRWRVRPDVGSERWEDFSL